MKDSVKALNQDKGTAGFRSIFSEILEKELNKACPFVIFYHHIGILSPHIIQYRKEVCS